MKIIKNINYKSVATLLLNDNIVAIFQGKSESGPRALGNRSILFNPCINGGRNYVNKVKQREIWRPFAGTILKEYANQWFDLKYIEESPWMSYAIKLRNPQKNSKFVSTIIHNDHTCRIQTLSKDQNLFFWNLIYEFWNLKEKIPPPIIGNTSFNAAGDPLVHSFDDAIQTLEKTRLEYMWMPESKELIFFPNQ